MAKSGGYDLILTGKETIDFNGASVGGMIAGLLDLPFISLAAKLELSGNQATLVREIEGGEETVEVKLTIGCRLSERNGGTTDSEYERYYGCTQ